MTILDIEILYLTVMNIILVPGDSSNLAYLIMTESLKYQERLWPRMQFVKLLTVVASIKNCQSCQSESINTKKWDKREQAKVEIIIHIH